MIPVKTLVLLESRILEQLGYSLYISPETFLLWTEECNVLFDIQLLLFTQPTTTNILNNDYHYYYDYSLQEDVPLWTLYQPEIPVTINDMWYPFLWSQLQTKNTIILDYTHIFSLSSSLSLSLSSCILTPILHPWL